MIQKSYSNQFYTPVHYVGKTNTGKPRPIIITGNCGSLVLSEFDDAPGYELISAEDAPDSDKKCVVIAEKCVEPVNMFEKVAKAEKSTNFFPMVIQLSNIRFEDESTPASSTLPTNVFAIYLRF